MAAAWSEYGKYNCIRTWSEVPTSTVSCHARGSETTFRAPVVTDGTIGSSNICSGKKWGHYRTAVRAWRLRAKRYLIMCWVRRYSIASCWTINWRRSVYWCAKNLFRVRLLYYFFACLSNAIKRVLPLYFFKIISKTWKFATFAMCLID